MIVEVQRKTYGLGAIPKRRRQLVGGRGKKLIKIADG